ncbi:polyadenylate-binding protein 4 [Phycodurus eques]|uniref:polyadenylate-binding protein 4 n=1 Tax=Phycodurus eques TaxID=693459 RepID=UPI002ACDDD9D|nr:polyadenylate-binding protein 4 [Phycodurus eques]XP_061555396.1 polyadenylate-binding protein 4 [Phycodurus eques]XP_061555397.1 polyadenylate-binding protein 4 [Phycodurus eques]XP_061555399.1 polyadenylate-binding protein 4 [Phycodurus eques]
MDNDDNMETLGEQLYTRIFPAQSEHAGKLTGMLLELPVPVLIRMLQDEAMLALAVEKAVRALQGDMHQEPSKITSKDDDDESVSSDSLGEQLFDLVDVYNTGYSQKITGMLLEQDKEAVLKLLSDPKQLETQVNTALKTLKQQHAEVTDVSDTSDAEDTEGLGEKLFLQVEELDQLQAHEITGMLLEMDAGVLHQLLRERTMLEAAVHKAKAALST